ncbi:hypothetical protein CFP56_025449 [Quercus suber]|uniref:Uncharacterized protein n=1 Tax=Quercus suber TaxID=58331 RepID=A0AAW0LWM4_QUESU
MWSVRPLVSGTNFAMNKTVKPHMLENVKNFASNITTILRDKTSLALPVELQSIRKLKAYDTIQEPNQLTNVTRLPAEPFMFMGNI